MPHIQNTYREKLLNATVYFAKNVGKPSKLKIYKLLFFLDFQHFKETGRNVTDLTYLAMERGPVPVAFYSETQDNYVPADFERFLTIETFKSEETGKEGGIFRIKPKIVPDLTVFSPREKKILDNLVFIYKDVDANEISEISHLKNTPWDKTKREKGINTVIDYLLAIDRESPISIEEAKEQLESRKEMLENFPLQSNL